MADELQNEPSTDSLKDNAYAASRDAGHRVKPALQVIFVLAVVALIAVLLGLVLPQHIFDEGLHHSGTADGYTFAWFLRDLQQNVNRLFGFVAGDSTAAGSVGNALVTYVVIMLAGASLALCGALYQSTFRNALVTPSTLGVMSGAILGMALWVVFFYDDGESHGLWFETVQGVGEAASQDPFAVLWQSYGLSLCTFIGCVAVVGLVLALVRLTGNSASSPLMLIVMGQVIAGVMSAIVQTIRYYYIEVEEGGGRAEILMQLQISSFYRGYGALDIACVGVPLLILFAFVMAYRRQLTLLAFPEAEARSLGVETRRLRWGVVALATLLTAIVVSFCGRVGFVGFIVPHLARRLVGPHLAYLLPTSMILGAVFVLGSYILINVLLGAAYSTMAGMFVSIAGAAVFLYTAIRGKGDRGVA